MPTGEKGRPECWIFFSENLPMPLRGRHRCVGEASAIGASVDAALACPELLTLRLVVGEQDLTAYVNPAHIVAVMP